MRRLAPKAMRVACWSLFFLGFATQTFAQDRTQFDVAELRFGATLRAAQGPVVTPDQAVLFDVAGNQRVPFSMAVDQPWLEVRSSMDTAPVRLTVGVRPDRLGAEPVQNGRITLKTSAGGVDAEHVLPVVVTVFATESRPPFGFFEGPAGDRIALGDQPVALTGWALDDVSVTEIAICRDREQGGRAATVCGDRNKSLIGYAKPAYGVRADVRDAMNTVPDPFRAAWSFSLERSDFPSTGGSVGVYAVVRDGEGHPTLLGSKTVDLAAPSERATPLAAGPIWFALAALAAFGIVQAWLYTRLRSAGVPGGPEGTPDLKVRGSGEVRTGSWRAWIFLSALSAVFVFINARHLAAGLTYDELYTASHFVAGHSPWHAMSTVSVFNNHFGFSVLAVAATKAFGATEWALRLPAFVLAVVSLWLFWKVAETFGGPLVAWIGTPLLAIHPFFAEWSHAARGYAGLTAMCLLSTYGFFRLLRGPSKAGLACHVAGGILAVYFNLYGIWILGIQFLLFTWFVLRRSPYHTRTLWLSFTLSVAGIALLLAPVFSDLAAVAAIRGRAPFQADFPIQLYGEWTSSTILVGIGLLGFALVGLYRQRPLVLTYLVFTLAAPLLVAWIVLRPFDLYPRFFAFWTPFFVYLVASGVKHAVELARTTGITRVAGVAALAAFALVIVPASMQWVRSELAPVGDAYRDWLRPVIDDRRSASYSIGMDSEMFDYYMGKPFRVLPSRWEVNQALHDLGPVSVAYHDMSWNSTEHQLMADVLKKYCAPDARGPVVIFRCG